MEIAQIETPIGSFRAYVDGGEVRAARFVDADPPAGARRGPVADALVAYFDGDVEALDALTVRAVGTQFQQRVWTALRTIAPGTTASYGEVAAVIGAPSASRAVGMANASNPVGIIVPCHRVIRSDGSLSGYGFGVERKRWLLDHEAAHADTGRVPMFVSS